MRPDFTSLRFFCFLLFLIIGVVHYEIAQPIQAGPIQAGTTAQTAFLRGTVTDDQKAPVPFSTVALHRAADSTLAAGVIADESGAFAVAAPPGRYYLKLSAIGYQDRLVAGLRIGEQDQALGALVLTAVSRRLDEVTVVGEKSRMELTLDKRIFNVGKDLANAGGTASDVLKNIPSVAVDGDGNVSLRGSNSVRILIDGKPSGLVSFKGGSGLQQLQGSMIERVEVITNPSARYEAEGMGGIINIVLKKERKEGINGSFDLITGNPANFGAAANVNYRRKNWNFFVNYTASYRNTPGRNSLYQETYTNDTTRVYRQNSTSQLKGQNNNARAGIDYYFSPSSILTGSYTWRISKGKRFTTLEYLDYQPNTTTVLTSRTNRTQDETETEPNSEYALSWRKTFGRPGQSRPGQSRPVQAEPGELTADLRYLDNWEKSDQYFAQQTLLPDSRPSTVPNVLQRALNDETEKQLLLQVDYVKPFAKEGKLESGLRLSSRNMTNDYSVTQQTPTGWVPLPGLTNDFLYVEKINAFYGILSNKLRKFAYQMGLRAEWTDVTTTLRQTNDVNPRQYANLFPSVHATYDLPQQHALQLSYSRRVRRPQYNDLSPFMTFSDNRNFFSGNPDLNPEFTNAFELGHVKYVEKGSLTSSVYYRHTTGKIIRIRRVDEQGNSNTRPENLATENSYGAEFAGSYAMSKSWKLDGSVNFFRAITNGGNLDASYQSDTYSWYARLLSQLTILKRVDAQLRGNYEAPQQTPQGLRKAIATLDMSFSRDVLRNNGTLVLNVIDVFNSRRYRSITEGANFYTESNGQGRLRQINLTLNYRLHQAKKKTKEPGEGEF